MGTWVLMIWMVSGSFSGTSTSITNIPGYSSEMNCQDAGKLFQERNKKNRFYIETKYTCLEIK